MKIDMLSQKVGEYARGVLAPKTSELTSRFALGAASVVAARRVPALVAAAGAVGPDGEVDIALLREVVKAGFEQAGHLDLFGVLGFDQSDADDFFAWLGN